MHGYPFFNCKADGGDFILSHPYSGESLYALGVDMMGLREVVDDGFFDFIYKEAYAVIPIFKVDYGVAYQLTWPVKGDVSSAGDGEDFYTLLVKVVVRKEDITALGVFAEGNDGRVFAQEEDIIQGVFLTHFQALLLNCEHFSVLDQASSYYP